MRIELHLERLQFGLHQPAQLELGTQLGRLRPPSLGIGPYLGQAGPVGPRPAPLPAPGSTSAPVQLVPHVSTQLAQDRRRSSAQTLGDETYRVAPFDPGEDVLALRN